MTTIVADRRGMCADTFSTVTGGSGYYAAKIERVGNTLVGAAGSSAACRRFIAWRRTGGRPPRLSRHQPFEALVLDSTGLYLFHWDCVPDRLSQGAYAIGSGKPYALGALHTGAASHVAVTAACAYDPYSKPPIQREKL